MINKNIRINNLCKIVHLASNRAGNKYPLKDYCLTVFWRQCCPTWGFRCLFLTGINLPVF